jgi:hypothetical protein
MLLVQTYMPTANQTIKQLESDSMTRRANQRLASYARCDIGKRVRSPQVPIDIQIDGYQQWKQVCHNALPSHQQQSSSAFSDRHCQSTGSACGGAADKREKQHTTNDATNNRGGIATSGDPMCRV